MATEIERKFLVLNDDWRARADAGTQYRQGYLSNGEKCSVRVRVGNGKAKLNIKSVELGMSRSEFEYAIPVDDAEQMLSALSRGPLVEKTRYLVSHAGHEWEVDVFSGDNQGLMVAEVELTSTEEAFERPSWAGLEVTGDSRYYNVCLVEHPFKDW